VVDIVKYLGVTSSSNMIWNAHINNITSKAQKLLVFLRRNLQIKNEHSMSMAYKSPFGRVELHAPLLLPLCYLIQVML
jgi:hypothetical protein